MKYFSLLIILVSAPVYSQFYSEIDMKAFFSKNKECKLAIGLYNPAMGYPELKSGGKNLGSYVYCITDIKSNEGTAREKSGCGFATFNVHTGILASTYLKYEDPKLTNRKEFAFVEGIDCDKGGFQKLMLQYPGAALSAATVGEFLSEGPKQGRAEKIIVYASNIDYERFWRQRYKGEITLKLKEDKINCEKKHLLSGLTEEQSWECASAEELKQEMCNNEFKDLKNANASGSNHKNIEFRINKMNRYYFQKTKKSLRSEEC